MWSFVSTNSCVSAMLVNKPLVENDCHKTVIVLDRGPKFAKAAGSNITLNLKDDQGASISGVLEKSLWNCSVEAALEFHRVVADLFPRGSKQLRFVVSDFAGRFLTRPWSHTLITHEELLKALSTCDAPQMSADASSCSIMNGVSMAIEVISERTKLQRTAHDLHRGGKLGARNECEKPKKDIRKIPLPAHAGHHFEKLSKIFLTRQSKTAKNEAADDEIADGPSSPTVASPRAADVGGGNGDARKRAANSKPALKNRGTIVVLTALESADEFSEMKEAVIEQINSRNDSLNLIGDENYLVIDHINLIVINILDRTKQTADFQIRSQQHSPKLSSSLTSVCGGQPLLSAIHKALQDVYDLVSTTVSGIPMKEEAQQGQSVNYDVELLHHRNAHVELMLYGIVRPGSKIISKSEDGIYETICLKWCTSGPKLKSDKFPLLQNAHLLTPANVNSRPTVCLTSFVLAGKCVMLEVSREMAASGADPTRPPLEPNLHQKLISHYLSRDEVSGALVIHSVAMGEKALMNGFLSPVKEINLEPDFDKEELNLAYMSHLMSSATLTVSAGPALAPAVAPGGALPPPNAAADDANAPLLTWAEREEAARRMRQNVWNLTQYFPQKLSDSFIFNVTEVFEDLFVLLRKPTITADEFEGYKKWIFALVDSKNRNDLLTTKSFACSLTTKKAVTKEEQFRMAFEELAKIMHNFSHVSPTHFALLDAFVKASGVRFTPPTPALVPTAESERLALEESRKRAATDANEREILAVAKKFRKKPWVPGEVVNLLDHFTSAYEENRWATWKEFVGRENAGDKAQAALYPNLKVVEPAAAATATAADQINNSKTDAQQQKPPQQQQQQRPHHQQQLQHHRQNHPHFTNRGGGGGGGAGRGHAGGVHGRGGRGNGGGHHGGGRHGGGGNGRSRGGCGPSSVTPMEMN